MLPVSIGTGFEIVGLVVTAIGVRATWREFASPQDRFLGPVIDIARDVAQRTSSWLKAIVRRLLRRPNNVTVAITGTGLVTFTGKLSARIGYGALPKETETALTELGRRTQQLMDMLNDAKERLDKDTDDIRADVVSLKNELGEAATRFEERTQHVALDGLRTEAVGLFLVGLGVLLQSLGF